MQYSEGRILKKKVIWLDSHFCKTIPVTVWREWRKVRLEADRSLRRLFQYILLILLFLPWTDIWINSCLPEIITTDDPLFNTETATYTTKLMVSDSTHSELSTDGPDYVTTTVAPPLASTSTPRKRKLICITEAFMDTSAVATERESDIQNRPAFKNEAVGFGGKNFLSVLCVCVCAFNRQYIETSLYPDWALRTWQILMQIKAWCKFKFHIVTELEVSREP